MSGVLRYPTMFPNSLSSASTSCHQMPQPTVGNHDGKRAGACKGSHLANATAWNLICMPWRIPGKAQQGIDLAWIDMAFARDARLGGSHVLAGGCRVG